MSQMPSATPPPAAPSGSGKLLLVAIGVALLAVVLVNVYIETIKNDGEEKTFTAYILKAPMDAGDIIDSDDYNEVQFPLDFRDEFERGGFICSGDDLSDGIAEYVGKPLVQNVERNAALRVDHFIGRNNPDRVPVSDGMRIMSIPVNSRAIPASLEPGVQIDVLANVYGDVMPVMEKVRVVGVGRNTLRELQESGQVASGSASKIDIEIAPALGVTLEGITEKVKSYTVFVRPPADTATDLISRGGPINQDVLDKLGIKRTTGS